MRKKAIIIIIAAVVLVLALTMRHSEDYSDFMRHSTRIAGHIIGKEERKEGGQGKTQYWVTYRYTDDKGFTHTTKTIIEYPDVWQKLHNGQVEMIYYDKNNSNVSYLAVVLDKKTGKK